ncbi:hypothetical protein HZB00_04395 [Candidatus Woesearchaeota archaeon]|nr:hypothetical protein [Candidatus Woesearchaeota archaeon]
MKQIVALFAAVGFYAGGISFAEGYHPLSTVRLPVPRYKLVRTEKRQAAGKQYIVPIVEDQWEWMRREKVSRLQDLLKKQGSCKEIKVDDSSIACTNEKQGCVDEREHCYSESFGGDCKEWCVEYKYWTEYIRDEYKDLKTIKAEKGFLFCSPAVYFQGKEEQRKVTLPEEKEAQEAALLLSDLKYIATAMEEEKEDPLRKTAEQAQENFEKAKEKEDNRKKLSAIQKGMQNCFAKENDEQKQACLEKVVKDGDLDGNHGLPRVFE